MLSCDQSDGKGKCGEQAKGLSFEKDAVGAALPPAALAFRNTAEGLFHLFHGILKVRLSMAFFCPS